MREDAPVLVVGGRTTGLTMACELARHGAPVRIVDRSPGIDPHCRATLLHSRTLEIFHDLGIVDAPLEEGEKARAENFYVDGARFLRSPYEAVDSPFPWGISLPQSRTEELLEGLLAKRGVAVERDTALVAAKELPDGVRATLRHADGRDESVETPWLVGCDGSHSTVRELCGADFPGEADPHQYMIADVALDTPLARDEAHGFLSDQGALFLFMLPEGRRLVCAELSERHDAATGTPTLEQIQSLVDARCRTHFRVSDPRWLTYFRINYRLARHYRAGRSILAGDAVHVHSLLGGHGMNTGIQDAYNLAWKLALVARRLAPESLLDSYEVERRQVAQDVIATTRRVTERAEAFAELSEPEREKLCAKMVVPEPEQRRAGPHREALDLDYRKSPICTEHADAFEAGPHAGAEARDAGPLRVDGESRSLFELLRGPQHTLLLFEGAGGDASAAVGLRELAESLARAYGALMRICIVRAGNGSESSPRPPGVTEVCDPEQSMHARYGADAECLYLIRPDGYVAYRGRPASSSGVREALGRVFRSSTPGQAA